MFRHHTKYRGQVRREATGSHLLEELESRVFLSADILDGMPAATPGVYQFIFTSDAHYGTTRTFHGQSGVSAQLVNEAMLEKMKLLPSLDLPNGEGKVGSIDFIAMNGDIANRMDKGVQSAVASWNQFAYDYLGLDPSGQPIASPAFGLKSAGSLLADVPLYFLPGNHDVSNAIGHPKMVPAGVTDPTSMVQINNLMLGKSLTNATFDYAVDKVNYSRDVGGVHLMFVNMWPDASALSWMAADLAAVNPTTPVLLFTHDQPEVEIKHFTDPAGKPPNSSYENLLVDTPADQNQVWAAEQRFIDLAKAHPNLVGYFHGNDNYNQFYNWIGPDRAWGGLSTFRVDSPMKGTISGVDESKLSFQLVTLDTNANTLTAREYLWNLPAGQSPWGASTSMRLFPNQTPSFVLAGNPPAVDEDAGGQVVSGFATGITAGPAYESAQHLSFHVSISGSLAFTRLPAIDPVTGDLTYEAAPNAHGTATVSVALQDDGGTAHGGVDTSPIRAFTITINAVNDRPVAEPQAVAVAEDGCAGITLAGADLESVASQMSFTIVSLPAHGVLRAGGVKLSAGDAFVGSPSELTYEPGAASEAMDDSFAFTVTDTGDASVSTESADMQCLVSSPATVQIQIRQYSGVSSVDGILRIGGTAASDVILSGRSGLLYNGAVIPLAGISEVRIWGRAGNDVIDLGLLKVPSVVIGGEGDDVIVGGSTDDLILGGGGHDITVGGEGDDFLIGGQGRDRMVGSSGDDILLAEDIAASLTIQDLRQTLQSWASTAAISGEAADDTVRDDLDDMLTGGSGSDWFIIGKDDEITDWGSRHGDAVSRVS